MKPQDSMSDNEAEKPLATELPKASGGGNPITPTSGDLFSTQLMKDIVIGIVAVLFVGFAGMFIATGQIIINALNDKTDMSVQIVEEVMKQNAILEAQAKSNQEVVNKLNTLIYEVRQIKISQPTP